jgi:hypothetical protein
VIDFFLQFADPLLFFVKYAAQFSVGLACAVWVLNGKTLQSYADWLDRRLHAGRQRVPTRA